MIIFQTFIVKTSVISHLKGDLGAIDEKYDVAVSTACGALDNLVVDTIDTAQQCVEYLKQSQVGAATFIALDKQEKWREHVNNRSAQYPESAKRLVDLIEVPNFETVNFKAILIANLYCLVTGARREVPNSVLLLAPQHTRSERFGTSDTHRIQPLATKPSSDAKRRDNRGQWYNERWWTAA